MRGFYGQVDRFDNKSGYSGSLLMLCGMEHASAKNRYQCAGGVLHLPCSLRSLTQASRIVKKDLPVKSIREVPRVAAVAGRCMAYLGGSWPPSLPIECRLVGTTGYTVVSGSRLARRRRSYGIQRITY